MKKFVRTLVAALCICLGVVGLAACGGPKVEGKVVIRGSTSVEPLMRLMMDDYMKVGKSKVEGVEFDIECQGSGAGRTAAQEDKDGNVIGMSSSALTTEQAAAFDNIVTVALDAIAVIVHSTNGVANLAITDLYDIFTGAKTNWSEVEGSGLTGNIYVNIREAGSGTRDAFDSLVKNAEGKNLAAATFPANHGEHNSTNAVMTAVASNANAIGYISLGSVNSTVKVLKVGGVDAKDATVLDGTYKLQRPFVLFTKKGLTLTGATQAFYSYLKSSTAQAVVKAGGFVQQLKTDMTEYK